MARSSVLEEARASHLAGRFDEARALYAAAQAEAPGDAGIGLRVAILELQCGNGATALERIDRALTLTGGGDANHHFVRGEILTLLGRRDAACDAYRAALSLAPERTDAAFSLGNALQALGRPRDALDAYTQVLRVDPMHADAANNLGNCHRQLGDIHAAETAYRAALASRPGHANALCNLGALALAREDAARAAALLREADRLAPETPAILVNLGVALLAQRQFDEAAGVLTRAKELDPHSAHTAYNLGNAFEGLARYREAAVHYERATALDPAHADAFNNLGNVLRLLGEPGLAAAAFDAALRVRPGFVAAHNNAANLLRARGCLDEAEAHLRAALASDAQHAVTLNHLGNVMKDGGALDEAIDCYRRALASDPDNATAHANLAYALTFRHEEPLPALDEARRWSARHGTPCGDRVQEHRHTPVRSDDGRVRIGYVSADLRNHCQALFLKPLLANHDHSAFEIVCYANVARPDATTEMLTRYADKWRDIHMLDDVQAAQLVRDDGIDILVDLTMYMANGRGQLFARKPAPVQAAWLAYPGTTGLAAIDYRLTDPHLDPPGHDSHYSERSIRLADTFWCYDPLAVTLPAVPQPEPALLPENRPIRFGCLNNPCKLTDRTFALWSGVFDALPDAQLLLMAPPGKSRARLLERMRVQGIDPERVRFVPFQPRADYLATYREIDVVLDTFPYNGHTTSLDALWMGVPVVTRVGRTAVGRGGLSQLANLGLTELAAYSDGEFARIAVALAQDVPRLTALREGLRACLEASPLMDGARFARAVEAAYRQMVGR